MKIDILTLFPKMFLGPFDESIIKRAIDKKLVEINIHDLRKWGLSERKTVDDRPYGGGVGMILRVDVISKALEEIRLRTKNQRLRIILLDAGGKKFNQKIALRLSKLDQIILIAGHYEGVDYRVHEHLVDEVISIGDYILTGGEIPIMVIVDSVVRLIPGVLQKKDAIKFESFSENLLEFSQYTRPEIYKGWKVPKVLLSGNHKKIEKWRQEKTLKITKKNRPDLVK
ncbi:tRNA (guanosine(37)-N1)-methyltransferase TrmD [Candidatus Woesebacteria bacterium RIFCSPHIGHO2_02_FULL_38_9]|uniref:tRNA (guanine-N(1)-)-methyltransferase n=1 Tax=Candidatus Woesebacteria bacterium RIFCSPHIGHO2_01_FULL_39_28 TaxID=1802496 RepID=A0A1F7YFI7_9BACT|nr:MAG: tRNA (guanosine(37)-N1)-methyltransferase TrmD [Candidatus Woesebacteria bacterium RIFCSPHIGHO2_01_FULL_39_28]OGM31425.1 MAG: tRNA (guanosine(37)-N1)-methyltransferase TrmD [Candidatus Woesebacteria bacterium RIFCSPHIGHO2_02_FULL_38_9]OGM58163.1 MAG: tRNA (guanosine(37)-N1)-methyltransferase TrmD [Candidatus Woesebacteria bacterium RIFCSPLOWO2_01_FULL_38_20]